MYSVYGLTLVSGLLITPIIVGALGTEQFGVWSLIGSIFGFVGLLDLGLAATVVRFSAEQRGRDARHETSATASTALALYVVLATVAFLVGLVLAWLLPVFVELSPEAVQPARVALLLMLGSFAIRYPLGMFGGLLAGQQRYDLLNLGNIVGTVLYFALAGGVLYFFDGGLVALAVITVVTTLVRLAIPLAWLRRELPELRVSRALATRREAGSLLRFSLRNLVIQVAARVLFQTDVIVAAVVFGGVAAGIYGIPAKLFALAFGVAIASNNMLFPLLSELEGADEREQQERYLFAGVRLGVAFVVAVSSAVILLPEQFLDAWLPDDFDVVEAAPILTVLMVSLLFAQPGHLLGQFLVARGQHGRLAVARLATVLVNLILSVALAKLVGLWGIALATLITEALSAAIVIPLLVRRAAGVSLRGLAAAWVRPVLLGVVAVPLLLGVDRVVGVESLLEFIVVAAVWAAAYGAVVWRFGLAEQERRTIRRGFARGGSAAAPVGDQPVP